MTPGAVMSGFNCWIVDGPRPLKSARTSAAKLPVPRGLMVRIAVGFAAKRFAPRTSLGWLLAAPMFLDLIWPLFGLTGLEAARIDPGNNRVHAAGLRVLSLVPQPPDGTGLGRLAGRPLPMETRYLPGALAIALGVVSHWVLDFVSHRPDMPLAPGATARVGLGLWDNIAATVDRSFALCQRDQGSDTGGQSRLLGIFGTAGIPVRRSRAWRSAAECNCARVARSLGLKTYGIVDKTGSAVSPVSSAA